MLTDFPGSYSAAAPAWTRVYLFGSGFPLLSIKQVTGVLPEVQGDVVTVHGHPARYREGSGTDRSVTWFDGSFTLTVLSVEPVVGLPQAELLRIAENVNPPASHGQAG